MIAETGKKRIGQIVSAERGQTVTFVGIVNAIGNVVPPAFVFPRVRFKNSFMTGAPEGSLGLAHKSGWMTSELFPKVLLHIKQHTICSVENKILLLLDNHNSHIGLESILFARENGIEMLSFPPHCSHRLQPLDIAIFGPFKQNLKVALNDFMAANPGKIISYKDVPKLATYAYQNSFTAKNILASFRKPGIWPLNRAAFNDDDFDAAFVTDRPFPEPNKSIEVTDVEINANLANPEQSMLSNIRPYPKAPPRKQTARKRGKSRIFTSTPEKDAIASRENEKKNKLLKPAKLLRPPKKRIHIPVSKLYRVLQKYF